MKNLRIAAEHVVATLDRLDDIVLGSLVETPKTKLDLTTPVTAYPKKVAESVYPTEEIQKECEKYLFKR